MFDALVMQESDDDFGTGQLHLRNPPEKKPAKTGMLRIGCSQKVGSY
jgi:hypothetical protein